MGKAVWLPSLAVILSLNGQGRPRLDVPCPADSTRLFPVAGYDRVEAVSRHLWSRLGAAPLCGAGDEVYRLVVAAAFSPAVAVTVRRRGTAVVVRAQRLDRPNAGRPDTSYQPFDTTFAVELAAWQRLERVAGQTGFRSEPTLDPRPGVYRDGVSWYLEWTGEGRYHLLDRWMGAGTRRRVIRLVGTEVLRIAGLVPGRGSYPSAPGRDKPLGSALDR